mmetsp:Transcript_15344/g.27280  ORF Transcript_15344/g.27280 Transcript_15344/m.27280 type:complete len:270 (-) Transcript_15344:237-1046(-)
MEFTDLLKRFGADVLAGTIAGAAVTPIISAVDRALAENASGKAKLYDSFFTSLKEYGARPITYLRGPQFAYIWLIYGGTYIVANCTETFCAAGKIDASLPKWIATSTTNTATCIVKDKAFAQMFGTSVPSNVPKSAYAAWLSRDFVSMGVFFTLPPIVGRSLAKTEFFNGDEDKAYYTAQMALPLLLQTVTTPLHLLGYNIYNDPAGSISSRIKFLQKDYLKNVSIRMVRMAPPWSLGTIGNREARSGLLSAFGMAPLVGSSPVYHVSG